MAFDNRRFRKGLNYVTPELLNRKYWVWTGGIVPAGEGMYATNAPLPHHSQIGRINCAGLINLFFRAVGKRIPTKGNAYYDGGVAAYAGGVYGPGYFEGYSEPFDINKAKRWANTTRSGVLLMRPYWNATLAGQGHVAILLPEYTDGKNYVLQSFQFGYHGEPGANWDYTIEQSHSGDYYTAMVAPWNWIDYKGDEVFKASF